MIINKRDTKGEVCGRSADVQVVADGFDDAPANKEARTHER